MAIKISGQDAGKAFKYEAGTHCIQRNPPTENKGRKHTSVVSVMILPLPPERTLNPLPLNEVEITTQRGHGPGGQHQNTTDSAVRAIHKPTGLHVFVNGRDQKENKKAAIRILTARVNEQYNNNAETEYGKIRKDQRQGGGRGNKIRTYNILQNRAVDHRFNIKTSKVRDVIEKGRFDLLHKGDEMVSIRQVER